MQEYKSKMAFLLGRLVYNFKRYRFCFSEEKQESMKNVLGGIINV